MNTTIGTCSVCGGPVQIPAVWFGVTPPEPACARCGAVAQKSHGPVIPMEQTPAGDGGQRLSRRKVCPLCDLPPDSRCQFANCKRELANVRANRPSGAARSDDD